MNYHEKIDLSKVGGLPISLEYDKIVFKNNVSSLPVQSRTLDELKDYLQAKDISDQSRDIYLMYRDAHIKEDESLFRNNGLRYDITVIFFGLLGKEFYKTAGHHHIETGISKITYPEIYEVLYGTAYFLLQKITQENERVDEIYLIKGNVGQKVVVPPMFGHITINPTQEPLIVANIFADNVGSIYEFFKKHRGAAYYITKENNEVKFEKNPNYNNQKEIKISEPNEFPELGAISNKPLYKIFKEDPKKFEYLTNPKKFVDILTPTKLFKI